MADINKKIKNLVCLSDEDKYHYFIRKVVDFEQIWGLFNDGWALLTDESGNTIFPFWPEKEIAEICATNEWDGYEAKSISLDDFVEKWLPGLQNDSLLLNIFYVNQNKGKTVQPQDLLFDLNNEIEQYY